jgi:hypothetical protein
MWDWNKKPSGLSQPFIWTAVYSDGTHLSEFDLRDFSSENAFYSIEKGRLASFGLVGPYNIFFNAKDGIFFVDNQQFEFSIKSKDVLFLLSGLPSKYDDIITYKDAFADMNHPRKSRITQFNVGFKKKQRYTEGTSLFFKIIFHVPLDSPPYFSIKITPDAQLTGEIQLSSNFKLVDAYDLSLEPNQSAEIRFMPQEGYHDYRERNIRRTLHYS